MHRTIVLLIAGVALCSARDGPDAKGRRPLLGWNTWCTQNTCGVDWCTSSEVLDVAQAIKTNGMLDHGYDHILLDDCWGVRDNITRHIEGDPGRFPEGMQAFIKKIHNLGFKFGLYTDIGEDGCHHPFVGSWPDYQRDANTFASWEVDYVKFDGCHLPQGHDPKTLTCNMSQALNNTGRDMWLNFHCWDDEYCAKCGNSFRISSDHHDVWDGSTSATDTIIEFLATNRQPFWGPDPDYGWPDPDFVYTGGQGCGEHSGAGVRCPGQTETEYRTEYSIWAIAGGQIVLASDPRNMTDFMKSVLLNQEVIAVFQDVTGFHDISRIHVDGTAVQHSFSMTDTCSVSLIHQRSQAKCTLHETFGCEDGEGAEAATMWTNEGCRGEFNCNGVHISCNENGPGKHTCSCKALTQGQVWFRPLDNGDAAAVIYNPTQNALVNLSFTFESIPARNWSSTTALHIRDLWQQKDIGVSTGKFTAAAPIPSHGSVFLKLSTAEIAE